MRDTSTYSRYFKYIKPVSNSPIVKTYGSIIFTLITVIIFIFFAIKPTIETIVVLQKKIDNAKTTLAAINKKANDLSKAKDNYQKIDQFLIGKIQTAIPNNVGLNSLVTTLEQTAIKHEATISAIQIEPLTVAPMNQNTIGTLAEINFTFNSEGSYDNILAMLSDFKNSGRVLSVNRVSITSSGATSDLIMSITGKSYYLK